MKNIALLVIDVQNALVEVNPYDFDKVINNIKLLIDTCRTNKIEVIYIQHTDKEEDGELKENSEGWRIYNNIAPNKNEVIINKNYNSAFKDTKLNEYLESKGITNLIVTGMQTEYCIDTTCKVAFEKGYKVIIPEKTNTTFDNGILKAKVLYEFYNYNIFKNRFVDVVSLERVLEIIKQNS